MQAFFFAILLLMQATFAQSDGECIATEPNKKANKEFVLSIGKFTDNRDGKTYKTTKIGSQTWMAENLNYAASSSKCYDNKPENCAKYGRLYSWAAAMDTNLRHNSEPLFSLYTNDYRPPPEIYKGICPEGWHLPNQDEWHALVEFADRSSNIYRDNSAGKKLRAKKGWNGTDDYGFSALPGGKGDKDGNFVGVGYDSHWWSAREQSENYTNYYSMYHNDNSMHESGSDKSILRSVRCINDMCNNQPYNSSTHFCSDGVVYEKCLGEVYKPKGQKCSADKKVLLTKCFRSNNYHNNVTQFCSDNGEVYEKCGDKAYDISTHFCSDTKVYEKCGAENKYNVLTQFCSNNNLKTYNSKPFTDVRDKKIYKTTKIGSQTWMAENLNYSGAKSDTIGVCYQHYDPYYCARYGRIYDWNEAMKACPKGWHLPNDNEWKILFDYIGGEEAGRKLKANDWSQHSSYSYDLTYKFGTLSHKEADNSGYDDFGFSAIFGGSGGSGGGVYNIDRQDCWWSATGNNADIKKASAWILFDLDEYKPEESDFGYESRTSDKSMFTKSIEGGNKTNSFYHIRCIKD